MDSLGTHNLAFGPSILNVVLMVTTDKAYVCVCVCLSQSCTHTLEEDSEGDTAMC